MSCTLDKLWESHRDHLRHVLIGLTRDIDLADDLLMETYLRARAGIPGYRGGDGRAWLTAIARNVFNAYLRRTRLHTDTLLDLETVPNTALPLGSSDHAALLDLRESIGALSDRKRAALVMRHYGGFSYKEIADQQGCSEATARVRVWKTMQELKAALSAKWAASPGTKCSQVRGTLMLDFLYGGLTERGAAGVRAHLEHCNDCRAEARTIRKLMRALDAVDGDYRATEVIDLDVTGMPTRYSWSSMVNDFGRALETYWWTINKSTEVDYAALQGEEVKLQVLPFSDTQYKHEAPLPRPAQPGEAVDSVLVTHPKDPGRWAEKLDEGRWRFCFGTTPNSRHQWVLVLAIRLPPAASLTSAEPDPSRVTRNGTTTAVWRRILPSVRPDAEGVCPWQFECAVEYQLQQKE